MNLDAPATEENIDQTTEADIFQWATQYLPRPSAEAFTEWLNSCICDWENGAVSIRAVLTGAYQQWTGNDYPNPPA